MTAFAQSWAFHVAHLLWQTSVTTLFALVLLRLLRRESARLRHAIALVALAKFVIPPMLPLPTGVFSAAPAVPPRRSHRATPRTAARDRRSAP